MRIFSRTKSHIKQEPSVLRFDLSLCLKIIENLCLILYYNLICFGLQIERFSFQCTGHFVNQATLPINQCIPSQYIYQDSRTLVTFCFHSFNSFLAGLDRNRVYSACCLSRTASKQNKTSPAKQTTGAKVSILQVVLLFRTQI